MFQSLYRSAVLSFLLVVLLCGFYPLAVTLVAKVGFRNSADGGLIVRDGRPVGMKLIGQSFTKPEYFHGRPSAAGDKGYDASNSSGSNLGPTSEKLVKDIEARVKQVIDENPGLTAGQVPVDLVTASASGLDPHISPEAAYVQVDRVAKARAMTSKEVKDLVTSHTEGRQLGIFGEPVVNVLELNLALDAVKPVRAAAE